MRGRSGDEDLHHDRFVRYASRVVSPKPPSYRHDRTVPRVPAFVTVRSWVYRTGRLAHVEGDTFHAATFSRSQKPRTAGWDSASFGINDLPHLAPARAGHTPRPDRTQRRRGHSPGRVNLPCQSPSRGRSGVPNAQTPHSVPLPAARAVLRLARFPFSPLGFGPFGASTASPLFGGKAGLGATPAFPREMRHGIGLHSVRPLPASGSLPARAEGAIHPCGKASNPPGRWVDDGGRRGRPWPLLPERRSRPRGCAPQPLAESWVRSTRRGPATRPASLGLGRGLANPAAECRRTLGFAVSENEAGAAAILLFQVAGTAVGNGLSTARASRSRFCGCGCAVDVARNHGYSGMDDLRDSPRCPLHSQDASSSREAEGHNRRDRRVLGDCLVSPSSAVTRRCCRGLRCRQPSVRSVQSRSSGSGASGQREASNEADLRS